MKETKRNQALSRLKNQLDTMSRKIVTKLPQEYCIVSLDVQRKREQGLETMKTQAPKEKRLKQLKESISKYSFGSECIIEELVQLYQVKETKYDCAGAAADICHSHDNLLRYWMENTNNTSNNLHYISLTFQAQISALACIKDHFTMIDLHLVETSHFLLFLMHSVPTYMRRFDKALFSPKS